MWGYIDTWGEFLISPRFEDAWFFSEGLAPAKEHGKWGFIGRSGEFVIPPQFDDSVYQTTVTESVGGLAGATLNGRFGYIDKAGSFAIGPSFTKGQPFDDGIAEACDPTRCGYIDRHGNGIWPKDIAARQH